MMSVAITGAGRGIGLELVRQYGAQGYRVLALCRDPNGSDTLRTLADASGGKLTIHAMDVGDDRSVELAAEEIGAIPVDILLNVAGIVGPTEPELEGSDWAAWDDVLNIMLKGPLRVLQAFLPKMTEGSKVITLTSQLAASTWPYGGYYAYGAAKAGLNRMMRSAAIDLNDRGIIVGLIHPGYVQTEMSGPSAEITPAESAAGIRAVAADWTIERSGAFLKWNGETHPF